MTTDLTGLSRMATRPACCERAPSTSVVDASSPQLRYELAVRRVQVEGFRSVAFGSLNTDGRTARTDHGVENFCGQGFSRIAKQPVLRSLHASCEPVSRLIWFHKAQPLNPRLPFDELVKEVTQIAPEDATTTQLPGQLNTQARHGEPPKKWGAFR